MQDTKINLATCPTCGRMVYRCQVSGVWTAADVIPLDDRAIIALLTTGRDVFRLNLDAMGVPATLRYGSASVLRSRRPTDTFVSAHGCPSARLSARPVALVDQDPTQAPARLSESHTELAGAETAKRSPAGGANRRRFDGRKRAEAATYKYRRCSRCRRIIRQGERFASLEWEGGIVLWARHADECSEERPLEERPERSPDISPAANP